MRLVIVVAGPARAPDRAQALGCLAAARRRGAAVVLVQAPDEPPAPPNHFDVRLELGRSLGARWNAGARTREGEHADVLLFLPAGTRVPEDVDRLILRRLAGSPRPWGSLRLPAPGPALASRLRALLLGVALREQGLFFTRALFTALAGFDPTDPHEDLEIGLRARLLARPWVLPGTARGAGGEEEAARGWAREAQAWREVLRRYNAPLSSSSP